MLDNIQKKILEEVADLHKVPEGAYNIRANSQMAGRNTTANIDITSKEDKSGIDIRIKDGTKNESVHIPVVISESGLKEVVYNDFYIGEDCDVVIVAGCGIHNCGDQDSQHDGVHRFFVGKNSRVVYVEKHYGEGDGKARRNINPVTEHKQHPCRNGNGTDKGCRLNLQKDSCRTQGGCCPYSERASYDPRRPEGCEHL